MASEKILMGLDIGSAWVRAVIGSLSKDGKLTVDSICECPSEGVRNGLILNPDQVHRTITSVIQEAELQAGAEVQTIVAGIGGSSIKGIKGQGITGINAKGMEITSSDIYRSLDVVRSIELGQDRMILRTLIQDFIVDGKTGIKDPVSLTGHRLETRALIVTGSQFNCQNITKSIQRAGIAGSRLVPQQLADADIVLNQDEKETGVILINIGSNITNMIVYQNGSPQYVGGIDLGGSSVTGDIAYIFKKTKNVAEQIKCEMGSCYIPSVSNDEKIIIPQVGGLPSIQMPKKELTRIIEPRMAEIFSLLKQELEEQEIGGVFGGGVVLVGGGSLLSGVTDLASEIFRLQTRIGFPAALPGLDRTYIDPRYTTVLGLLNMEARRGTGNKGRKNNAGVNIARKPGLLRKLSNFFKTVV